jgi:hypothetical protein
MVSLGTILIVGGAAMLLAGLVIWVVQQKRTE